MGLDDENIEQLCWGYPNGKLDDDDDESSSSISTNSGNSNSHISDKESFLQNSTLGSDTAGSKSDTAEKEVDDDDEQEPLAFLVVHATMHMLFLPQFTCDFYEDVEDNVDLESDEEDDGKSEEERQSKEDGEMRSAPGAGKVKFIKKGISLVPRPASIIWAAGCGVSSSQVRRIFFDKIHLYRRNMHSIVNP